MYLIMKSSLSLACVWVEYCSMLMSIIIDGGLLYKDTNEIIIVMLKVLSIVKRLRAILKCCFYSESCFSVLNWGNYVVMLQSLYLSFNNVKILWIMGHVNGGKKWVLIVLRHANKIIIVMLKVLLIVKRLRAISKCFFILSSVYMCLIGEIM